MKEQQGKNGGTNVAMHDVLYQQISSSSYEPIKAALGLVDEADEAAHKMVAECETLLAAVRQGTEQIRSELREKMVEFRDRDARIQRGDRGEEQGLYRGSAQHHRHDQL